MSADDSQPLKDSISSGEPSVDFEQTVAPLLQARCLNCHGQSVQEAGLRLDSRARILQGGTNGAVVEVGKAMQSRLMKVLTGTADDHVTMPPEGPRLRPDQIDLLRRWIDQGLTWPATIHLDRSPSEVAQSHWAFRAIVRPIQPSLRNTRWPVNGIDSVIMARLEQEQVQPSPEADRQIFVRRVTLDLTGLPPTVDEFDAFVADDSPDSCERLVDRLLASPRYGERWARPWLDLCHYGDTDGYLTDQIRPVAWRYRQWLIEALNSDMPLGQFTIEQLAGDLLPNSTVQQKIATGFLRNTLSNREGGADLEEYRVEQVVDRTSTVGTAWMGLTVGCARCHDHKYDPLSQRDFYGLFAYFDKADEVNIDAPLPSEVIAFNEAKPIYDRERAALIAPQREAITELQNRWEKRLLQAAANPGQDYQWDRQWEILGLIWGGNQGEGQLEGCQIVLLPSEQRNQDQRDRLLDYFLQRGDLIDSARFKELKLAELSAKLEKLAKSLPPVTRAPTMRETQNPHQTFIHLRGDFRVPGQRVNPNVPDWLASTHNDNAEGTRLELANWLAADSNPLTARVFVNRAWQELFGRGLVGSSDNFGLQGERPTHPELLDWLADELRVQKGRFKSLHRLIVTSATYRQSSRVREDLLRRDPTNQLYARQTSLRLSAEQIRDGVLAASGLLAERIGGPSVFPPQPDAVAMEGFDNQWKPSPGSDRYRRGLYTWIQRLSPFAQGVTFDAPANARTCSRRERSNTPLQALTLLNDPTFWEAAQSLSERISRESPHGFDQRLNYAFRVCLGRSPQPFERDRMQTYFRERIAAARLENQNGATASFAASPDQAEAAAWTGISSILLNLHEFITRD